MKLPHRRQFLHLAACAAALSGYLAHRKGRDLSVATGAFGRGNARRRIVRCSRAPNGSLALGAPRPAVCHREPARGRYQHRHRVRRACTGRRLYDPCCQYFRCDQRDLVRKTQFQFHPRHCACCRHPPRPRAMVVQQSFQAKTVPEFIAVAKSNPGKITMASGGTGSAPHVYGELFKMMAGVDLLHVPYRGWERQP